MPIAIALHVLAAVIWVGGMFFAYMALRPAAGALLDPPQRLPLWSMTLYRFFNWVSLAVVTLLVTGYWMIFAYFGGMAGAGLHIHLMQALGILMMLLYLHAFFAPFKRLKQAVIVEDWPLAGQRLDQIRKIVAVNLVLGLITVALASGGRYVA